MNPLIPFLAAVALALIHIFSGKLRFLDKTPRSRILSFGGGVAVALVFLEILPELSESQDVVAQALSAVFGFLRNHIYVIALLGLIIFYGVRRSMTVSRQRQRAAGKGDATSEGVFWLSMTVFSIKNAIVGYLLLRDERTLLLLLLFVVAVGLEFTLTDRGLHREHKAEYDQLGRWILAAAILGGWLVGYFTWISEFGIAILQAFLAGFIILNVLKEELPEVQDSSFGAFTLGAVVYAALLLAQQAFTTP